MAFEKIRMSQNILPNTKIASLLDLANIYSRFDGNIPIFSLKIKYLTKKIVLTKNEILYIIYAVKRDKIYICMLD